MNVQFRTENRQDYVFLPTADYEQLLQEIEDAEAIAAVLRQQTSPEPTIPGEVLHAILEGESPINAWRRFRGLSVTELAKRTGLSRGYVHAIEAGTKQMSVGTLLKMGEALDANIAFLVTDAEEE